MPYSNKYKKGGILSTCDVCGFDYRLSDLKKGVSSAQTGLMVCEVDFDDKHLRDTPPKLRPIVKYDNYRNQGATSYSATLIYLANGTYIANGSILAQGGIN